MKSNFIPPRALLLLLMHELVSAINSSSNANESVRAKLRRIYCGVFSVLFMHA